jgi:hypothetical protein
MILAGIRTKSKYAYETENSLNPSVVPVDVTPPWFWGLIPRTSFYALLFNVFSHKEHKIHIKNY